MQTICELGAGNIWTGKTAEIADDAGCPTGWVADNAPGPGAGLVAQRFGSRWAFVPTSVQTTAELKAARADALGALSLRRAAALRSMPYLGYSVGITAQDRADIASAIAALTAKPDSSVSWEIVDGVFKTFTLADMQALSDAVNSYIQGVYRNAATLTAAIHAAPDAQALAAVDLASGWPS